MQRRRLVWLVALLAAGCTQSRSQPEPDRGPPPAVAETQYVPIGDAVDGQVSLAGSDRHVRIRLADVTADVPNPLRAVELAAILNAPGSLKLLHETIAEEADDASLEARYAFNTDPGVFAVTVRIDGDAMAVTWSLERLEGRPDVTVPVPAIDSTRLADALRAYLMKKDKD